MMWVQYLFESVSSVDSPVARQQNSKPFYKSNNYLQVDIIVPMYATTTTTVVAS